MVAQKMPSAAEQCAVKLRKIYGQKEHKAFFDWASEFINDVSQTTVARIQSQLATHLPSDGNSALDFGKSLQTAGCATLVLGRHGRKTRLEWIYTLRSIGMVARGDSNTLEPRDLDDDENLEDQNTSIRVEIPLVSKGSKAVLEIPQEITEQDGARILQFVTRFVVKR